VAGVADEDRSVGFDRNPMGTAQAARNRWAAETTELCLGRVVEAAVARDREGPVGPTDADAEGRTVSDRMYAMLFARDEDVRRRFVTGSPSDEWQRAAFALNTLVELTPADAEELWRRLFAIVDELRQRPAAPAGEQALVSVSVLQVLE
jgi:hypothetical protein